MTDEKFRRAICAHRALQTEVQSDAIRIRCACGRTWVGMPVDFYLDDSPEITSSTPIIADALREGRDQEALVMFVEFNWRRIKDIYTRLQEGGFH